MHEKMKEEKKRVTLTMMDWTFYFYVIFIRFSFFINQNLTL